MSSPEASVPRIVTWFVGMGGPPCRAECSRAWCKLRSVREARHCARVVRERKGARDIVAYRSAGAGGNRSGNVERLKERLEPSAPVRRGALARARLNRFSRATSDRRSAWLADVR